MSHFSIQFAPLAAGLTLNFFALNAFAQSPHPHTHVVDAKTVASSTTSVAGLRYDSVFARYQSHRDEKTSVWREANETVDRVGGWRVYAREAQLPDVNAPAKPNPHEGHGAKP